MNRPAAERRERRQNRRHLIMDPKNTRGKRPAASPVSDAEAEVMLGLRAQGCSEASIARATGRSGSTVHRVLARSHAAYLERQAVA